MAQLIDVKNAVNDVQSALQKTNWLPDDFECEPLQDLLSALKILPDGTALGAHTTLRASKTELQDFEDRHFLTSTESHKAAQDTGIVNKLSRHSDLGKEFRLLKSACDSALAECRRQAGTTPDDEEPPQDEQRMDAVPNQRIQDNARLIAGAMGDAHTEIDSAIDDEVDNKDIVIRIMKDTQHLSLTTRAVVGLKTKSIWVGQQLQAAWSNRYALIEKSVDGLKAANGLSKYGLDKISKVKDELRHVLHDTFDEIADDVKIWAQRQKEKSESNPTVPLPPIPDVDPDVQEQAEEKALEFLKAGKAVPPDIGKNLRRLGTWYGDTYISDITWLKDCPYLQKLRLDKSTATHFEDLKKFKFLTLLDVMNTQFSDLTLLTEMTELQYLNCIGTQVNDLTPLSEMTELQYLHCSGTQVNDLTPLSEMTKLQYLHCDSTQVNDLTPLSKMTKLYSLICRNTQVNDLTPLSKMTELQSLDCSFTQVNDLTPLSKMTEFKFLNCIDTQVSDLTPLSEMTKLQILYCDSTQVNDLTPLSKMTELQWFHCRNTQVNDLTPLSEMTELQVLYCSGTQVNDLTPLSEMTQLQELDCRNTQVNDLTPLSEMTQLQSLDCRDTQVNDLTPLSEMAELNTLYCSDTLVADWSPVNHVEAVFGDPNRDERGRKIESESR